MSVVAADSSSAFSTRMAQSDTGIGRSLAEDVSDFVIMISPTETPLLTMLAKKRATGATHEWLSDSLAAADSSGQMEGSVWSSDVIAARTRYSNPVQLSYRVYEVTGTMEALSQYGVKSEFATQAVKKMKELKRDIDKALWQNTTGNADSADITGTRTTQGYHAVIDDQSAAQTGSAGYHLTALTSDAAEDNFNYVLQKIWTEGPTPNVAFMLPQAKRKVSKWTGVATKYFDQKEKRLVNVVDYYESDFGVVRFVIDRYMEALSTTDGVDAIFAGNFDNAAIAYLRPFQTKKVASVKDSEAGVVLAEYANEYGHPESYGSLTYLSG